MKRTRAQGTLRELRRGQIVAAARALVASDGLDGLTIAALEKKLGFSRGVITYHFRDKDEIVVAVLHGAVADIDADTTAALAQARGFDEMLRAVIRTKVHGFVGNAEAGRILLAFWGRLQSDPKVRKLNAQLFAGYRAQSRSLLEAGQRARVFAGGDVDALAALVVGTVIGIATQAYFEEGSVDVDAAVEEASRALWARLAR